MKSIKIYSKKDIQEIVKKEIKILSDDVYKHIDKIRNQLIDLNNIIRVMRK